MARGRKSNLEKSQIDENSDKNLFDSKKVETVKKGRKRTNKVIKSAVKSEIWNINSILSKIFIYCSFKDLVKFNTVCKRWNQLTNPIIHRRIKLSRNNAILNKIYNSDLSIFDKIEAEIEEYIINNAKHAHFAKEFVFFEKSLTRKLVEFFETFKYITILGINNQHLSEFEFLNIIKPLAQLQELNLNSLTVYRNPNVKPFPLAAKLPSTLTKLSLSLVRANWSPESFIETIKSHTNLIEFKYHSNNQNEFLDPFLKNYPTLKTFEYKNQYLISYQYLKISQSLCSVFESNPQILRLTLELQCWNSTLANFINRHLNNLEEFTLSDMSYFDYDTTVIDLSFTQPTKIKTLYITWNKLSPSSVESILINCPELEALTLKHFKSPLYSSLNMSLNLVKPIKIKKLSIDCNILYKSSFESFLLKCPHIEILDIQLPIEPEDFTKIVGTSCANIKELKIYKNKYLNQDLLKLYYEDLYNDSNFKATLSHLTLKGFGLNFSAAEYFEKFTELNSIIFLAQTRTEIRQFKKNEANKSQWPNFNVTINENGKEFDVILIKPKV